LRRGEARGHARRFRGIAICAVTVAACADETVKPLTIEAHSLPFSTGEDANAVLGKTGAPRYVAADVGG